MIKPRPEKVQISHSAPVPDTSLASPVCYADEASNAYSGYADREELLVFLNELLEAERAGARIAARTATETGDPRIKALLRDIQRDEARWCALLLRWIAELQGDASPRVGDSYKKCLAIAGLKERIAFINRGQGWVVRKLRDMLPRMRDDAMHADFAEMLTRHEDNIARANAEMT